MSAPEVSDQEKMLDAPTLTVAGEKRSTGHATMARR
jgi:hypothetical protein